MVKVSDLKEFDAADFLKTPEDRADFVSAAFEDGDPAIIRKALGAVARSMGMKDIAEAANLNRESLYRSLGENGNPELATVLKLIKAMGLTLAASPSDQKLAQIG